MNKSIYIGFDPRESLAFFVAAQSIRRRLSEPIPICGLELAALREKGLYRRSTSFVNDHLYDDISQHPMATEFAISRFLVPYLAQSGWALFMDCDMLVLTDLAELFAKADPQYAVMCVKHVHVPTAAQKMSGEVQSRYYRKNWSSFCLFNVDHPSNRKLTLDLVNSVPGRDLHAFCWLEDHEIGALDPSYNYLVGYTKDIMEPKVVHFTEGGPWLKDCQSVTFSETWRREIRSIVGSNQ